MCNPQIEKVRARLDLSMAFAESMGLETYDPFDTKGSPIVTWSFAKRSPFRKAVRSAVYGLELFAPILTRRLMGIQKQATAGGIARLAQAHLACFRLNGQQNHIAEAEKLLRWLLDHPGISPQGLGWGVPFGWSTFFGDVPANTAVSHTTQACGHAFLDFHDLTGQTWAFEAAEGCCDFFTKCLNQTTHEGGSVSISYTPLDKSEVVNISAEGAGFLLRAGRPSDQPLVWKLGKFVAECQAGDGSFPYSSPGSVEGANPIDHYHTGMVLNGLMDLATNSECLSALETGLDFHLNNHFLEDGCPRMRPSSTYPIDAYSAGESLLVLNKASQSLHLSQSLRTRSEETLENLIDYILKEMSYSDGGFVYRKYKLKSMRLDSLRWAQALMCHGLAEYCLGSNE